MSNILNLDSIVIKGVKLLKRGGVKIWAVNPGTESKADAKLDFTPLVRPHDAFFKAAGGVETVVARYLGQSANDVSVDLFKVHGSLPQYSFTGEINTIIDEDDGIDIHYGFTTGKLETSSPELHSAMDVFLKEAKIYLSTSLNQE